MKKEIGIGPGLGSLDTTRRSVTVILGNEAREGMKDKYQDY